VREFRPPEEVFNPESLASLAGAPLTIGHPRGGVVTASNWSALTKGHVGDSITPDGNFVSAPVRVQDAETCNRVDAGDYPEMSCGYTADMDDTPGEWEGQKYDCIQRNIRYNHLALLPRNTSRAGPEVGIRLDSMDELVAVSGDESIHYYVNDNSLPKPGTPVNVLDAKDFVSRAEFDALRGENESLKAQLETERKLKTDALDAASPANLDKHVAARTALVEAARHLHPEIKTDGLTAHEIRVAALKHGAPAIKVDGESEAYVQGVFAAQSVMAKAAGEAHKQVQEGSPTPKNDSAGPDKVSAAKAAYQKRMSEQYKGN
jgi:hypothetical protein